MSAEHGSHPGGPHLRQHPGVTDDEAHAQLLSQLRARLGALATDHGAQVRETNNAAGWYWPGTTLVLEPAAAGATAVTVFGEDAYTRARAGRGRGRVPGPLGRLRYRARDVSYAPFS
jgi:hypothetical protein